MTTKLNRAKQKMRSWQREYHNLRRLFKDARRVVDSSCNFCDVDEAEGAVIDHCDACCRRITGALWGLLMDSDGYIRKQRTAKDMLRFANALGKQRAA